MLAQLEIFEDVFMIVKPIHILLIVSPFLQNM